jgi:hypothetical protein
MGGLTAAIVFSPFVRAQVTPESMGLDRQILDQLYEVSRLDANCSNALYLFLRVAGVFWILVEWIAAWVLYRTYKMASRRLRERGVL